LILISNQKNQKLIKEESILRYVIFNVLKILSKCTQNDAKLWH